MAHRNFPAPPAPAALEALFVAARERSGDGSNSGHVASSYGQVEVHCKRDGSLLIPRHGGHSLAWFSPIQGGFHIGDTFSTGMCTSMLCSRYMRALESALEENRFYRLLLAHEVAPDAWGIEPGDALLWRDDGLLLRRSTRVDQPARLMCVPLNLAWWPESKMKNWPVEDADVLRAALSSTAGKKALAKATERFCEQPKEEFWSHVRCRSVEVSDLRAALLALRRLQLLGWIFWSWPEEHWGIGLDTSHNEVTTLAPLRAYVPSGSEEAARLVNALLQATDAHLQIGDFLNVTRDERHLFRRAVFWKIPSVMSEEEEIASWTAHDRLETVYAWNSVAAQLDSPFIRSVRAPQENEANR